MRVRQIITPTVLLWALLTIPVHADAREIQIAEESDKSPFNGYVTMVAAGTVGVSASVGLLLFCNR